MKPPSRSSNEVHNRSTNQVAATAAAAAERRRRQQPRKQDLLNMLGDQAPLVWDSHMSLHSTQLDKKIGGSIHLFARRGRASKIEQIYTDHIKRTKINSAGITSFHLGSKTIGDEHLIQSWVPGGRYTVNNRK